jgi:glucuronoarabinoxylan endo-1,4-beta-xylanase
MKSRYQMAALAIVLGGFTATAQTTIFDENFDGGYTGAFSTSSYSGGSPTGCTNYVLASGGNPNGCWQETMTPTTINDCYAGQVQLKTVSGNTDPNPWDYVVSFDAKGSQVASIQFSIQTWPGNYFGGSGPVINATVSDPLTAANTWQTFSVNLGSITTASPTGATWQLEFQINAWQWGGPGNTDTLTIDNITLTQCSCYGNPVVLTSSVNPSTYGGGVTFTDTVRTNGATAGNATGQVVFSSASGPFSTNTMSGGSATSSSITNLPVGTDLITAIYSGGNYPGRTNTLYQLVNASGIAQCVVDWNTVHQRIDGFGASSAFTGAGLTAAQCDMFFSTNTGIGLSLLRNHIVPAGSTSATATPSSYETGIMQQAQARGAKVWSTPWTPAAGLKSTNDIYDSNFATDGGLNGGSYLGSGNNATNLTYASQLANYVYSMSNTYGINIYAISVQNEPDANVTSYEACQWTGPQIHDFTTNLYNALVAKGVGSTKIIIPESESWSGDTGLYTPTLNDPNTAAVVGIIADHNYDGIDMEHGATTIPAAIPSNGKALWETEVSTGGAFDGSITDAMYWATRIHLFLTSAQANAWHYWWLISQVPGNYGLTDTNGTPALRMFVLGNYSRFVRPGYYRMGVTNTTSALISAYQETNSGTFVIVAINTNASTAISQTFALINRNIASATVTPWITSSTLYSTNSQSPVAVSGSSFTYTLPAMSVVTFVGQAYFNYTFTNGTITITGYTGPGGAVTIPSTINGYPVTGIGNFAFDGCTSLTSVLIGTNITSIGYNAFLNCYGLTNVTIPGSVTNIGFVAFGNCTSLTTITVATNNPAYSSVAGVLFNQNQTTLITYPAGKGGTSYTIPSSVTGIADYGFYDNTNLTSVTVPYNVTSLEGAFTYCPSLTSVYFGGNAPIADSNVFPYDNTNNMTVYSLPGTTGWGSTFGGVSTALWFLPNPLILNYEPSFGVQTNRFGFTISWATNIPVVVEACTNLAGPVWKLVATNTLTGGTSYFSDPRWTNYPRRFYRLSSP